MVNKVTFAGFRGDDLPLDPPLAHEQANSTYSQFLFI